MKLCYVCKENKPSFFFPIDISQTQAWCTILGCRLPNRIGFGGEKICQDHFEESDIYVNSRGARRLKKGTKPIKPYDDKDDDHNVFFVSKEHVKIGCYKSLVAASSPYLKKIISSSELAMDNTIYLPDTTHYIIKCYLDVLYTGKMMKIDVKYKAKMLEFLKLIQCNVLDANQVDDDEREAGEVNDDFNNNAEENEVEEVEDDNDINNEEKQGDNNDKDVTITPAIDKINTGPPRKKQKVCNSNRNDNMKTGSAPGQANENNQ